MNNLKFQKSLRAYGEWKTRLIQSMEGYREWLDKYNMGSAEATETLLNMTQNLNTDRVTLAFAAEFSRGKTELINAMFFSETGVRLLPSTPGRTTMCPTEIFYDQDGGNYIRLLPIETRLNELSLTEYKQHPRNWKQIELDCSSAIQMQEVFQELIAVKRVGLAEAVKLGLYHEDLHPDQYEKPETVEIPCWRHALISFPHELLKEGLAILDTPGLNALGTEPELTLNMLPNAQAVIFVLAADTGVTKSDLDMWRNHVKGFREKNNKGLAVVMNKIDALWDDLQGEEGIETSINSQIKATASILEIDENLIFPVSAKQALLSKVKSDDALLGKSRLKPLENYLCNDVMEDRRHILIESVTQNIGRLVSESSGTLNAQISDLENQLKDLRSVEGANADLTEEMMAETREEQSQYLTNIENFQSTRRVFNVQAKILVKTLDPNNIEDIMGRTRQRMSGSLTTIGMKNEMRNLLEELREILINSVEMTNETRRLVKAIYKKFNDDYGFKEMTPPLYSITKYQLELERYFKQGEDFRSSTSSTLMEQSLVIQKLYSSIINHARNVLLDAHKDAQSWSNIVLNPLVRQIKDHKKLIETRLQVLRKINNQSANVSGDISTLETQLHPLQKQKSELNTLLEVMGLHSAPNYLETNQEEAEEDMELATTI